MGENKAKDRWELNSLLKFDLKGRWRKRLEKLKTEIPQTLAVIPWVLLGWRWEKIYTILLLLWLCSSRIQYQAYGVTCALRAAHRAFESTLVQAWDP